MKQKRFGLLFYNFLSYSKFKFFLAYVERTPYEISYPSYGINLKTADETARWHCGFRVRQCPEFPLHYTIAMVGCFFSILLVTYFKKGGEINKKYENCIGKNYYF